LTGLPALLPPTVAVAIFFETTGLAAVAVAFSISLRVPSGKGMGVARDDLVDGFRTLHVVTGVLARLTETGLYGGWGTWSHILPLEKQAQYILRHRLLLQLQPVYLFSFEELLSS
jgi:hypothetical protein